MVALGGTFDILHVGHEVLLARAFSLGNRVLIGVTSDEMLSTLRKEHQVRSFTARVRRLRKFLAMKGWLKRTRIVKINDAFGPSTRRENLEALVVSSETEPNARKINLIRKKNGLSPLVIHVVQLVRAEDGKPISGTRIRKGEIDSLGRARRYKDFE